MSNKPPIEVPQGAIRLNIDTHKLEFYAQDRWHEMATNNINLGAAADTGNTSSFTLGGARGVFMGMSVPNGDSQISYINIPTSGNTLDFGSRTLTGVGANLSSRTRGLAAGDTAPAFINTIDFITMSTTGECTNFGDRTIITGRMRGCSNQTRGLWAGGFGPAPSLRDQIDFVTIASTGDAKDFGDLSGNREAPSGNINSPTRAIWTGGDTDGAGNYSEEIQFVNIASKSDARDFGDLLTGRGIAAGLSSATRGLIGGGAAPSQVNTIEYLTIATFGNSTDFGDCTIARYGRGSTTDCIRGVFAGGTGPALTNIIDYVNISTLGDAIDFGDFHNTSPRLEGGCSTSHGGL